jgi:hypothetical protein
MKNDRLVLMVSIGLILSTLFARASKVPDLTPEDLGDFTKNGTYRVEGIHSKSVKGRTYSWKGVETFDLPRNRIITEVSRDQNYSDLDLHLCAHFQVKFDDGYTHLLRMRLFQIAGNIVPQFPPDDMKSAMQILQGKHPLSTPLYFIMINGKSWRVSISNDNNLSPHVLQRLDITKTHLPTAVSVQLPERKSETQSCELSATYLHPKGIKFILTTNMPIAEL